jgi:hypothetical protein
MAIHQRLYERELPKSGTRGLEKRETSQGPIYYRVKNAGKVVELGDHYLYDGDSSYYAIVWAGGKFQEIVYGSTYGDQYSSHAEIDAPPDLRERWRKTKALREQKRRAANQQRIEEAEKARVAYELTQPHVGTIVEIAKGRKAPVGFIGRVSWLGQSQFGLRARVVNDHSGEFYFTAASNLRVISQPPGFRP